MPVVAMPDGTQVQFPDDMPPDQIRSMILQKFPDAGKPPTPSDEVNSGISNFAKFAGRTAANLPASAANMAGDIAHAVMSPVETATNVYNVGKGALQKAGVVSGEDAIPSADAVGQFFKNRYGGAKEIAKTIENDPVGFLADISTVLSGGGSLAAKLPGVAGRAGELAAEAGRVADPLTAVGKAAKLAGNVAAEAAGMTTGAGGEAIRTAARAGAEGGDAAKAFREGMSGGATAEVVADAKAAVGKLREERGAAYRQDMAKIGADNTVLNFDKIDNALANITQIKTYKGQPLNKSTQAIRQEIGQEVQKWKALDPAEFHTPEGLDALKQIVGDIRETTEFGTPARVVADQAYQAIRKTIIDQVPEYAKVMKGYEEATQIIREIESTLSLKPGANIDTSLRKLQSVLRNNVSTNYGRRAELVDFLTRAGAPHLMEKLAGQTLSSATPRGLARVVAGGEGASALGALALGHPAAAAALGGSAVASSPAIVGGIAHGLGASSRLPLRATGNTLYQLGRQDRVLQ